MTQHCLSDAQILVQRTMYFKKNFWRQKCITPNKLITAQLLQNAFIKQLARYWHKRTERHCTSLAVMFTHDIFNDTCISKLTPKIYFVRSDQLNVWFKNEILWRNICIEFLPDTKHTLQFQARLRNHTVHTRSCTHVHSKNVLVISMDLS